MEKRWSWIIVALIGALIACAAWIAIDVDVNGKSPHLHYQLVVVELVLVGFCMIAGYFVNERPDGIFIDERNRLSLSRLQWVAWLVVLLGGYFTVSVFVIAAGKVDLPTMQAELFGLLGIASGSAVLSNIIVESKKAAPSLSAEQQQGLAVQQQVVAPEDSPKSTGLLDRNELAKEASWRDLFYGEDVGNRYVVDISRLQKLTITVVLVITYFVMLWKTVGVAADLGKEKIDLTSIMPSVGATFLGLMAASHAAYLAGKVMPKQPAV